MLLTKIQARKLFSVILGIGLLALTLWKAFPPPQSALAQKAKLPPSYEENTENQQPAADENTKTIDLNFTAPVTPTQTIYLPVIYKDKDIEYLPKNPRVISSLTNEKSVYGGELRFGFVGNNPEWGGLLHVAQWENLTSWTPDFNGTVPNLVESIDVSDDTKEYTFHMREGMKWSDGEPFTANDIAFYVEDVMYNTDLNPNGPAADWLPTAMAEGFEFEKVDDYTFKMSFPEGYGIFPYVLAQWQGRQFAMYPRHYLEQFHADYNENIDELIEEDGTVADWTGLFFKYGPDIWGNPGRFYEWVDYPVLYPWVLTQPLDTNKQVILVRNLYYWKVDEQGNQLPYINKIVGISYPDAESRTSAMLNGDLDALKDPGDDNRIVYHDAMNEGAPISIYYPKSDEGNTNTIHFNQTIADEFKASVFADINFRIGMSYATDREEIIEIIFNGQGEPSQIAPNADGPFYTEGMAEQYVEYNTDLATEYLDKVLTYGKDDEGYYLDADGNRLEIIFTVQNDLSFGTNYVQIATLLIDQWDKVGVKVILNSVASDPYSEALSDNLIECIIFTAKGGAGVTPLLDPRYYVPLHGYQAYFGRAWYAWRVNDPDDVQIEPPQWAKDAYKKYEEAIQQPTQELQIEKMRIVLEEAKERFYVLGISTPPSLYYPFSSRLHGIPETWYDGWAEGMHKILYPEQWFITEE